MDPPISSISMTLPTPPIPATTFSSEWKTLLGEPNTWGRFTFTEEIVLGVLGVRIQPPEEAARLLGEFPDSPERFSYLEAFGYKRKENGCGDVQIGAHAKRSEGDIGKERRIRRERIATGEFGGGGGRRSRR